MGARFELQPGIGAPALDARHDFLVAAVLAFAGGNNLHGPALALGVAGVHAEQVAGEQGGFVATGAGPHFQEQVGFVARILGHQQQGQLLVEHRQALLGGGNFLLGQFAQLGVGAHGLGGLQVALGLGVGGQSGGHRFELGVFLGQRAEARVVGQYAGVGQHAGHFLVALGQVFELTAKAWRHGSYRKGVRRRAGGPGRRRARPGAGPGWARAGACW